MPTSRPPIGAFLALDDGTPAYLLESVEGGERLGRYSFLGILPRRLLEVRDGKAITRSRPVGVEHATELTAEVERRPRPARRAAAVHAAPPRGAAAGHAALRRRRGGRARLRRRVRPSSRRSRCPPADPVGTPLAAFLETDLVIVIDHLTHTLSAIAALHSDAPDFDRRYAVAERAVLRSARADGRRPRRQRPRTATRQRRSPRPGRPAPTSSRAEYIASVETAKRAIIGRRGRPGRPRPPPEPAVGHRHRS